MKNFVSNLFLIFAIWTALVLLFNRHDIVFYGMSVVAAVILTAIYKQTTDETRIRSNFI